MTGPRPVPLTPSGTVTPTGPQFPVRSLFAAAVAAALPVGLLYAVAIITLASPHLNSIEALELSYALGHATPHATPPTTPLWGILVGSLAITTGLSLVITSLCRALGPPGRRTTLTAAAACGVVFAVLSFRAGAVPPLPGAAAMDLMTRLRSAALGANLVLCFGLAVAIPVALRRLSP